MYYRNKLESLQKIFGTNRIELTDQSIRIHGEEFPIRRDVIDFTTRLKSDTFAEDIQYTFGAEWTAHHEIRPEHAQEFAQYFDLVDLPSLINARVCDLGCGSGRWSAFLQKKCRELVLVDFSEAIYVARENLKNADNAIFIRADITKLPLADNAMDFVFCLGVLHHLPVPCLDAVRSLKRLAPRLLVFLYYALDNRPFYFRVLLSLVSGVRLALARVRWEPARTFISRLGAVGLYLPLILIGKALSPWGWGRYVPLYEFYKDKSLGRIEQDVYDRFFTRIEQRVSRAQIMELKKDFSEVRISDHLPYWHFLLVR